MYVVEDPVAAVASAHDVDAIVEGGGGEAASGAGQGHERFEAVVCAEALDEVGGPSVESPHEIYVLPDGDGGPRLAELARHAVVCQAEELIP